MKHIIALLKLGEGVGILDHHQQSTVLNGDSEERGRESWPTAVVNWEVLDPEEKVYTVRL